MTGNEEKQEEQFLRGRGWRVDGMGCTPPEGPPGAMFNLTEALRIETGRTPKLSATEIAKLAPSGAVLITTENVEEQRKKSPHPFKSPDRLVPGDVVWALPENYWGHDLVVVWTRQQFAGLGINGKGDKQGSFEGPISVVDGKLVLRDTKSGRRFTLTDGAEITK